MLNVTFLKAPTFHVRTAEQVQAEPRLGFTFAKSRSQTEWTDRREYDFDALSHLLAESPVGKKDGPCYAPAVFSGTARKLEFATQIDVVVLDSDCGHSFEFVRDAIRAKGWRAIVHSTHSHNSTKTTIAAEAADKWLGENPGTPIGAYMITKKNYLHTVMQGAVEVERRAAANGKLDIIVQHHPCPKFRILLPLNRPWVAADHASQTQANAVWRERIGALAYALGLSHDQSCVDTSRLFYLPRRRDDAQEFVFEAIEGTGCDLWALPAAVLKGGNADAVGLPLLTTAGRPGGAQSGRKEHVTADGEVFDLVRWAAGYASRFEVVTALKARAPRVFGGRLSGTKRHLYCPNSASHFTNDNDPTGTYCVNASELAGSGLTDVKGFVIQCNHAGCKAARHDRLDHVRALLADGSLAVADLTDDAFLAPELPQVDVTALIANSGAKGKTSADAGGSSQVETKPKSFFQQVNAAALANIEPWFTVLFDDAEQDGVSGIWCSKSADIVLRPNNRSRDLSPISLSIKYGGIADAADAALQLCRVLDIEPESLGWEGKKRGGADWLAECHTDKYGQPRSNLFNVMLGLRSDPNLIDLLAFDEMLQTAMLMNAVPQSRHPWRGTRRALEDADISALQEYIQAAGIQGAGRDVVHQAVLSRTKERAFHPVRDYLAAGKWDGTARLETWLSSYLGAAQTEYTAAIGTMFLVSMVARVQQPGCKVDHMLVLEGPQNRGKSSACRILAGEWFSDSMPPIDSDPVRLSMHLRGKWLIEVAEMHAMGKADANHLKTFISMQQEKYTPKYGRLEVEEPRQCVFIGTTNKYEYLQDETGGRRFWPVRIGDAEDAIKLNELAHDRDQLFAEAMVLHSNGYNWWPTRDFEAKHITQHQEGRYEADIWEGAVSDWLARNGHSRVTVLEVAEQACLLRRGEAGTVAQRRIAKVLERLGWERAPRTTAGRFWVPVRHTKTDEPDMVTYNQKVVDFGDTKKPWRK